MSEYSAYTPDQSGRPVKRNARFYNRRKKVSDNPIRHEAVPYCKEFLDEFSCNDVPVTIDHQRRYPQLWAAFQAGQDQEAVGWAIDQVPFLDVGAVEDYRIRGIKTLEALAAANDNLVGEIPEFPEHKKKAIAMLKYASDNKPVMELAQKNDALEKEVQLLKSQMAEMAKSAAMQSQDPNIQAQEKRGPGRPPRATMSQPAVLPASDD